MKKLLYKISDYVLIIGPTGKADELAANDINDHVMAWGSMTKNYFF